MQLREHIHFGSVQDIAAVNSQGLFQYPPHCHDAAEFVLALRDDCRYRVGDVPYSLSRGDLLLIWPQEIHEVVSTPQDGTLFIQFSSSLLESNRDLFSVLRMTDPPHLIDHAQEPELTGRITDQMNRIMAVYSSGDFFRETRCKLTLYEMLLSLSEYMLRTKISKSDASAVSGEDWDRIRHALDYINSHYQENLRQPAVAAELGLSACYFSRIFRRYMQLTFPEYLTRVRVHAAMRLLGNAGLSVTDCAFQAGFQSITVFNRVFLETTGNTPREYRRFYLNAGNGAQP